ncbi:unnamed protein product [Prunus armeniaca]|uniref:Uncharacterized protein n=1 Tax=Prunus armeniaca TaxID=36596 RepID=A0A6J5XB69_PRUAR|nr:unnamed protein product [Prunus armeniaca]
MGRNTTMLMSMADQKTQAPKAKQNGMFTGNTLTSPWHYFSDHPCSSSLSYSSPFSSALCNWVWFELGFRGRESGAERESVSGAINVTYLTESWMECLPL